MFTLDAKARAAIARAELAGRRVAAEYDGLLIQRARELAAATSTGAVATVRRIAHDLISEAHALGSPVVSQLAAYARDIAELEGRPRARLALVAAVDAIRHAIERDTKMDSDDALTLITRLRELSRAIAETPGAPSP